MDKPGVQGCFLPQNTCKCCGAGKHNSYQHDENCISNVPSAEAGLFWQQGYYDVKNNNATVGLADNKAYLMGRRFAQKGSATKPSVKPIGVGHGIDLTI